MLNVIGIGLGFTKFKYFESSCKPVAGFCSYLWPVKITAVFFSIYLLCLAVCPCSDQNTCEDEVKAGVAMNTTDGHEHSPDEQDFCSPFCICQCCSTHAQ